MNFRLFCVSFLFDLLLFSYPFSCYVSSYFMLLFLHKLLPLQHGIHVKGHRPNYGSFYGCSRSRSLAPVSPAPDPAALVTVPLLIIVVLAPAPEVVITPPPSNG